MGARLGLLSIFLVFSLFTATEARAKKYLLRYKTSEKVDSFIVSRVERIVERSWTGDTVRHVVESKQIFKRKAIQKDEKTIATKLKMVRSKVAVNGKEFPAPDNPPSVLRLRTPRGEPFKDSANPGGSRVPFILPEQAVGPGDIWQMSVPADERFPAPLTVKYKLLKVVPYKGVLCALVHMETKSENTFKERRCRARVSVTGRVYFDIKKGRERASRSESTFILTYLEPVPGQPNQTANFTRITVKPREAAAKKSK